MDQEKPGNVKVSAKRAELRVSLDDVTFSVDRPERNRPTRRFSPWSIVRATVMAFCAFGGCIQFYTGASSPADFVARVQVAVIPFVDEGRQRLFSGRSNGSRTDARRISQSRSQDTRPTGFTYNDVSHAANDVPTGGTYNSNSGALNGNSGAALNGNSGG